MSRNLSRDRIQAMLTSYKIDVTLTDWIMKKSFDRQMFFRSSFENITDNTRYSESKAYVSLKSQISSSDQENSSEINSDSHNSSTNQKSQNSDRRSNSASSNRRSEFHRLSSRKLSSTITSLNEFVNESKKWFSEDDSSCVKCDELDHMIRDCINRMFSAWEQFYLKSLIFEDISQSNFCSADFDAYDDNVISYEIIRENSKQTSFNSFMFVINEISEKKSLIVSVETVFINAFYEEFESNKRSHQKQIMSDSTEFTLVSIERIIKKKSQKRVEKRSESQSLINMFDDVLKCIWKIHFD
jgi:hypothetical protein